MSQTESTKAIYRHDRVALYRQHHAAANRWVAGYGPIQYTIETQDRMFAMVGLLVVRGVQGDGLPVFDLLGTPPGSCGCYYPTK